MPAATDAGVNQKQQQQQQQQEEQQALLLDQLAAQPNDLRRYSLLRRLRSDNEPAFWRLAFSHTAQLLPLLYTPTVGEACQRYCELGLATQGLYISALDAGRMLQKLQAWPDQDHVQLIVVTDGERILGLGDLGVGGMGISEGKAALYTLAGGLHPRALLPVCLDVGTNNAALRSHPSYHGLRAPRLAGAAYDAFADEFMAAVREWRPAVLVQFEDFGATNAFSLLARWRDVMPCFNDDMQGTAAVALAAILAGLRRSGASLADQTLLFLGAGEAGTAIGELVAQQLVARHGLPLPAARRRCWFLDSRGLVCAERAAELAHHKAPFAHDSPFLPDLASAVAALRPSILIGVSAQPGAFTPAILRAMAQHNPASPPIILPLSNPTSKAECTAADAHKATGGHCIFASGSPFPPLALEGRDGRQLQVAPTQANNLYIFPAVGAAAVLTRASRITDAVFLRAAEVLAGMATHQQLQQGSLFPPLSDIRAVEARLCADLAAFMVAEGLGSAPAGLTASSPPSDSLRVVQAHMFDPLSLPSGAPRAAAAEGVRAGGARSRL